VCEYSGIAQPSAPPNRQSNITTSHSHVKARDHECEREWREEREKKKTSEGADPKLKQHNAKKQVTKEKAKNR